VTGSIPVCPTKYIMRYIVEKTLEEWDAKGYRLKKGVTRPSCHLTGYADGTKPKEPIPLYEKSQVEFKD
jgi:hypothetical protein